jgi:hypothetical protein
MHTRMKRMFPNACYLGFTGTPLMKKEKSTAEKFGGLIDIYAIDQAVKDGTVVQLLYEGRRRHAARTGGADRGGLIASSVAAHRVDAVGTPPEIAARLNAGINAALADEKVRKIFNDQVQEPAGGTAEQYAQLVRGDHEKYARPVKELNLKVE